MAGHFAATCGKYFREIGELVGDGPPTGREQFSLVGESDVPPTAVHQAYAHPTLELLQALVTADGVTSSSRAAAANDGERATMEKKSRSAVETCISTYGRDVDGFRVVAGGARK